MKSAILLHLNKIQPWLTFQWSNFHSNSYRSKQVGAIPKAQKWQSVKVFSSTAAEKN